MVEGAKSDIATMRHPATLRPKGKVEKAKRFEDLWIWQQARELAKEIYGDFRSGVASKRPRVSRADPASERVHHE